MLRTATLLAVIFSMTLISHAQTRSGNWLRGTWEGKGYQTDTDTTWTMRFVARGRKYAIEYPSLKCGGEWRLASRHRRGARFREKITYGKDDCTDNGTVLIRRLSRNQILFLYLNENSREVTASAVLNRKP